jgi:sulfide dehydrogenase [flavocytochrome c] flavoprotein subunit
MTEDIMSQLNRRAFLKAIAAASSASVLTVPRAARAAAKARVVIIGGGFAGATAAKYLKMMDPALDVTLIEANKTYTSCPLSNEVISGHRSIESLQTGYAKLAARGVNVVHDHVTAVDPAKKTVATQGGQSLGYDALIMAPGIAFDYGAVEGYSKEASQAIPHAYKAGEQTLILKKQLEAMPDGGKFIISVPTKPFRCPPGPYERAAQVAHYLQHHGKGKGKVIILDANDSFSKKALFEQGWAKLYPGMIEWVAGAAGGKVTKVDVASRTAFTDFHEMQADVLNIIPPHRAGKIAQQTGLTNANGWCEVVPMSMESAVHKDIYPVGDACIAGELPVYDMPKSAHMAITQAKVAAGAIIAKLNGVAPPTPWYVNTCYSTLAPDWGISVVHVFRVEDNKFIYLKNAGGVSPVDAPAIQRKLEAEYCVGWFNNVFAEAFA